ncbi:MAG: DUF6179 domain-containing protein [Clostridiaceae bacterium]|nr:DUF6179 domain-containing protein [Clostridiaceae bacterium]
MNNGLDKVKIIDRQKLKSEAYFQSLIEQAGAKGLLSPLDIERLQFECLDILAHKIERYNSGDSSSIMVEKAQEIMASIFFTVGLWLKTYADPDEAVKALQTEPMKELYQKGRKQIDNMLLEAKSLHAELLHQLANIKNEFYRDTLDGGLTGFFKLYNPDYSAQEIHITADYPIFNTIPKLEGIEFIKAYIEAAYYENQFCCYFSAEDIHHLLLGYSKNYKGLLINIYEPVLTAAIGCVICKADCLSLAISREKVQYLCGILEKMSNSEIVETVSKAADELAQILCFSQGLTEYIKNSLPLIVKNIELGVREHTLRRIFFSPILPEDNRKILFSFGEKMDDERYRRVLEEIGQCRSIKDKIAVIKENISSLADLEDVLLDADLTQEEVKAVLLKLSPAEAAVLIKKYQPMSDSQSYEMRECEMLLREALKSYIHNASDQL